MTPEENKRLLQEFVREVLDNKNLNAANKYLSPNFFHHDRPPGLTPGQQTGIEGTKQFFQTLVFPAFELKTQFEDLIAEGDLVAGRWTQTVRHVGRYFGRAASGKQFPIGGISIARIRGDKIVEEWEARDALTLLRQLDVIPPLKPLEFDPGQIRPKQPIPTQLPDGFLPNTPRALVSRFFYNVWNTGNLALSERIIAPNFVNNSLLGGQVAGKDGLKQFIAQYRSAFPDASFSVDLTVSEGDKVFTRWSSRGTQKGIFRGISPTGRMVSVTGISAHQVVNDTIAASWDFWEQESLLSQIGGITLPTPA